MFRFTVKPSSVSHSQYLAKITQSVQCEYIEPSVNTSMYSHWTACVILAKYWLWFGCATSRKVPRSIAGDVTWDFFRSSFRQNHVPWGRLSLWKWVPWISPGVKTAGAFGWRFTTLVVPKVEKIRGLNLPRTHTATTACHGIPLLYLRSILSPINTLHMISWSTKEIIQHQVLVNIICDVS